MKLSFALLRCVTNDEPHTLI